MAQRVGKARAMMTCATALLLGVLSQCVRPSLFEGNLDEAQKHQTRKNLAALAARPTPPPAFKFVFVADTHDGLEELRGIVDAINVRGDIEFLLHGGDFTDFGSHVEYVWLLDELARLDVPFFVTTGNHDLLSSGPELFLEMFGPYDYSFVYGGVRFVFFNTNTIEMGVERLDLEWLQAELRAPDGARASVVVTHHPPNSAPHILPEDQERFRLIQREGGVILNLHGHVHEGVKADRDGPTTYFKAGTALEGQYFILTTDGLSVAWERCTLSCGCEGQSEIAEGGT